jgi:hypothetical protein
MEARKEEDRDEDELVKNVKPLLEQAEKILNETNGAVRGADPDNRLSNKATRNMRDHKATPDEQRLAEALKVVRIASYYSCSKSVLMIFFFRRWSRKSAVPFSGPKTSSTRIPRRREISALSLRPSAVRVQSIDLTLSLTHLLVDRTFDSNHRGCCAVACWRPKSR